MSNPESLFSLPTFSFQTARSFVVILFLFALVLLAGCASKGSIPEPEPFEPWEEYRQLATDSMDFRPAATHWKPVDSDTSASAGHPVPAARKWIRINDLHMTEEPLITELILLGYEGQTAEITYRRWGFKDDSVGGDEYRIRLRSPAASSRWSVETVRKRYYCRRGVTESDLCL